MLMSRATKNKLWNINRNCLKSWSVYLNIFCAHFKFAENRDFLCGLCIKDKKNVSWKAFLASKFFFLFTRHKKYVFFCETTLWVNRLSRCSFEICYHNFLTFFNVLFWKPEHVLTGNKIALPATKHPFPPDDVIRHTMPCFMERTKKYNSGWYSQMITVVNISSDYS